MTRHRPCTNINNRLYVFCLYILLLTALSSYGTTYYVATDGNNDNPGSLDQPFATLQKGHDQASAGDTIYLRGGTYVMGKSGKTSLIGISITKSGTSDTERLYIWAYPDEQPVLDFTKLELSTGIGAGIRVQGEWLHFKGIEICNVKAPNGANNGIWCNPCSNNIFEQMHFHHIQGPELSIANGNGGILVLNCDAHDNYDVAKKGEDADGSLPDIPFLKLKETSSFIDQGTDIGLPYTGDAPDLGAYEFGAGTSVTSREPLPHPALRMSSARNRNTPGGLLLYNLAGRRMPSVKIPAAFSIMVHSNHGTPLLRLNRQSR